MFAPDPRFRIYSTARTYGRTLLDLALHRTEKDRGEVAECERRVCEFLGVRHAVCVPQNRVGVYLAIKHLVKTGREVILSPYTIVDIVNMVILAGGRPVFADVERATCNISADEVRKLIGPNTGAVLISHLHGLAAPAHEIREMCDARGIPMIEDTAQAFGGMERDRRLGTIGAAGVLSFGMYKNVNSWFGGAVVSNQASLIEGIRADLREHAYQKPAFLLKKIKKGLAADLMTSPLLFKALTYWVFRFGYLNDLEAINRRVRTELDVGRKTVLPSTYLARYTPFQARLTLPQLAHVDEFSEVRIRNGRLYHQGLSGLPGLIVPPAREGFEHIYMYYPIQHPDRTKMIKWLMRNRQDVAAQHYRNCAALPWFSEYFRDCPNTQAVSEQLIFMPTYPGYAEKHIHRNVRLIRDFFAAGHD